MNRLAILQDAVEALQQQFERHAPMEAGAFCLLRSGRAANGLRLLVTEVLPPDTDAWEMQGEGILRPTARAISAAISRAITARAGLLFVHSHPSANFPCGLSAVDKRAFMALARTLAPMLDGPFAAAVVHPDGWSGVLWKDETLRPIDRIMSVGRALRFLSPLKRATDSPLDSRQRDALGPVQDRIGALVVAVVGCGGLGSPMAEQLTRMGVAELILVDHDQLDTPSNLRRVFGSAAADLHSPVAPAKVDVVARHLEQLGLGVRIRRVNEDVRTESAFRTVLDADAVLSGTDTHGSRAIINDMATAYLLPVIDVGVRAGAREGGVLSALVAEVRVLTPKTPCLWCRGSISGDVIRAENLPAVERAQLVREGYVAGSVGEPIPSVVALTVLGSGLATCRLLSLLAEDGEFASCGYWVDGFLGDAHEIASDEPASSCRCRSTLGLGDSAEPSFIG